MATTREKMQAFSLELRQTAAEDTSLETRPLIELIQIAGGFGIDIFSWLIPGSDAEADVFIDQMIALFLRVRGDDLPPFDPGLYGEVRVNGGIDPALVERAAAALDRLMPLCRDLLIDVDDDVDVARELRAWLGSAA